MSKIAVIGAGTWGTVIANLLVQNGNEVITWARRSTEVLKLNSEHCHDKLPGIKLDERNVYTTDLSRALTNAEIVVLAIPSTAFREIVEKIIPYINKDTYFVSLTKGMEKNTFYTMSEVLFDELQKANIYNNRIVVLSGPTHAEEVGRNFPSTIVSASKNEEAAKYIQDVFMNKNFRVYTNVDIKGVEICAAFKNIIALASGILFGLGYGDNIRAALLTRGLAEMMRIGEKMGCQKETFFGLAGIGDMIVTACSVNSRNFNCGKYIGEGLTVNEAIEKVGMTVESINFIETAIALRDKYDVDLPIITGIGKIIIENMPAAEILNLLMTRKKKSE